MKDHLLIKINEFKTFLITIGLNPSVFFMKTRKELRNGSS